MGKINGCLKCLFIFFNVLFGIIGCVLVYGTIKATAFSLQMSAFGAPGLGWAWVFAIGVLGISSLGIYAGCSENTLALKIFAGFMVAGMVIMMIFGIIIVVGRNKLRDSFHASTEVKPFMEDQEMRSVINGLQESLHCCGVVSPKDWGSDIPASCECNPSGMGGLYGGRDSCISRPAGTTGPNQIYEQTCGDILLFFINLVCNITMGFCFGFAVTALLGLLVSLLMIHQVKRHDSAGGASYAMKSY
ncbi:23 kDa integral membrane protein [Hippoglossus stenolepis]|uniref:23 kDa integral membrane protein n=1 Tax=Hippoglossus stenolepis TaxID=195615 RepID=UPI00159C12C0|nr:23 kDa integral membrane protein [Hippoglossus stenolepis]